MENSAYLEGFRALMLSAARGLEPALEEEPTHETTARLALERIGDLMRAECRVPEDLGRWAAKVSEDVLSECVGQAEVEARSWPLPEFPQGWPLAEESADEGGLAFVLQRRDETESLREAVVMTLLKRGRSPVSLTSWPEFCATLRQVDTRLFDVAPRELAEHLLGTRMCLEKAGDWLSRLSEATKDDGSQVEAAEEAIELELPSDFGEPDDRVVFDYLSSGAMFRYVEGYALRNSGFAEDLATTIDMLADEGELGATLIPRRWRRNHSKREPAAIIYEFGPARLAAADEQAPTPSKTLQLGLLPELQAEVVAELSLSGGTWTLTLDVGSGELSRVDLNDSHQMRPAAEGRWCLQVPCDQEELRLRVEDSSGGVFEETIRVLTATP